MAGRGSRAGSGRSWRGVRSVCTVTFRAGDIAHSLADVSKARERLGYEPTHTVRQGLCEAASWYARRAADAAPA